jgi:hypothetical protein
MVNILILIIFFLILFGVTFFVTAIKLILIYQNTIKQLNSKVDLSFIDTLELATSDQLLKELRKRNSHPFVLLSPIKEKDYNGITIESHNVDFVSCLAFLHLAKEIAVQNIKRKGLVVPQLPSLEDYFEEGENF